MDEIIKKEVMESDGDNYSLHWEEEVVVKQCPVPGQHEQGVCRLDNMETQYTNMTEEEIIANTDQMAAENLMYLSQDVVSYAETAELDDPNVECVTEEVITDDWVTPGGQERVEVPLEHLTNPVLDLKEENDIDVPLPTDQDEYTAMRPWPCDFCSRRFRKKAALVHHMVAHQNDRPHACNLCGVRYVRKCDLMNHLKVHAFVPDSHDPIDYEDVIDTDRIVKPKKKRGRRKKNPSESVENGTWENMTSARTQQWSRRRSPGRPRAAPAPPASPPAPPSPPTPPSPPPPPTDPTRPFVCRHCGVGFAREKALQSHTRIHGCESPVECGSCGELCWSREALAAHAAQRHPHLPPPARPPPAIERAPYDHSDEDDDTDFCLSPLSHGGSGIGAERPVVDNVRGPELFCQDCGVAFQRVDLLRRHVAAAHSYKRHDSGSSAWGEHTCDVCGETCTDALQLLAHAEGHADRARQPAPRLKKMSRNRNNASSSSSRQFPCRECGKVFGSRSSQQIHIRIHTGERPYACRFCWKAFADGGTLRKHERIHTGEKPYACAVCPRAFNQRVVLREHVRSHHSAPDRRANGGPAYCCVVCSQTLHSSADLVQHLIQHCDVNTALKRQPQTGPRKYKRRRKLKSDRSWEQGSPSPGASPAPAASPPASPPSPPPPPSPPSPPRRRRRVVPPPPPRPRMIHTEEPRPRTKQVRSRRPPRRPADDLRAIRVRNRSASPPPRLALKLEPKEEEPPAPAPAPALADEPKDEPPLSPPPPPPPSADSGGPFKCEMCSLEFPRRDDLLLHVPVHI